MKLCKHEDCAKQSTHIYEKKDACYTKVKSRYDVWPSAYASGALVKCRKVGAKNWGNSKKESVDESKTSDMMKAVRKGGTTGPWDIIISKNNKIVKRVSVKNLKEIPAEMNDVKKAFPNHKIGIESKGGKIVYRESIDEGLLKEDIEDLKKIVKELEGASKMHAGQAKRIKAHLDDMNVGESVEEPVEEAYDIWTEDGSFGGTFTGLIEAEYQGRKVKLGKPMQGDAKKFKVYVKNPKGNTVKVNFGQGGDAKGGTMRIRKSNPNARKNFRARHNCDSPGPRHKARYWSCRKW